MEDLSVELSELWYGEFTEPQVLRELWSSTRPDLPGMRSCQRARCEVLRRVRERAFRQHRDTVHVSPLRGNAWQ